MKWPVRRYHDQQPWWYIELEQSSEWSFSLTVHKSPWDTARNNQVFFTHDWGHSQMVRGALEALFLVLGGDLDSIPHTVKYVGTSPEGSSLWIQHDISSDIIVSTYPKAIETLIFPSAWSAEIFWCLSSLYDAIWQDNIIEPREHKLQVT